METRAAAGLVEEIKERMRVTKPSRVRRHAILIEPHPDDIILSCVHSLLNPVFDSVDIVTVSDDPSDQFEDGVRFFELLESFYGTGRFQHFNGGFKQDWLGENCWDGRNKHAFRWETWREYYGSFLEEYGWTKVVWLRNNIMELYHANSHKSVAVFGPLGLMHPFHYVVRRMVGDLCNGFYIEWPYADHYQRVWNHLSEAVPEGWELVREKHPDVKSLQQVLIKPYSEGTQRWLAKIGDPPHWSERMEMKFLRPSLGYVPYSLQPELPREQTAHPDC